jgi:predicted Fe-Mo cluster-binding NifX family protein
VAAPVFNGRLSPAFDWAGRIVVMELGGRSERRTREVSLEGLAPPGRVERLVELAVEVLLCGGISAAMASFAESRGITVVPWLAGEVDEVLTAFVEDRLDVERFAMPGCPPEAQRGCCGRRRRHGPGGGRRGKRGGGRPKGRQR